MLFLLLLLLFTLVIAFASLTLIIESNTQMVANLNGIFLKMIIFFKCAVNLWYPGWYIKILGYIPNYTTVYTRDIYTIEIISSVTTWVAVCKIWIETYVQNYRTAHSFYKGHYNQLGWSTSNARSWMLNEIIINLFHEH